MSTSLSQPNLSASWKQEVNQRVAAHQNRKNVSAMKTDASAEIRQLPNRRAALVAARVAARYAEAPSYSEMLTEKFQSAEQAATDATSATPETQTAETQTAAEPILAVIEAPSGAKAACEETCTEEIVSVRPPEPALAQESPVFEAQLPEAEPVIESVLAAAPSVLQTVEPPMNLYVTPEPEPEPTVQSYPIAAPLAAATPLPWDGIDFSLEDEDQPEPSAASPLRQSIAKIEPTEPALPTEPVLSNQLIQTSQAQALPLPSAEPAYANLLLFPRELIATHKLRPRLADEPQNAVYSPEDQLSGSEVAPSIVSAAATTTDETDTATGPRWSGIKLDAQPLEESSFEPNPEATAALQLAPLSLRIMAALVDMTLIGGAACAAAAVAATHFDVLPSLKTVELCAVPVLILSGMLYQALFFMFGNATPGMKYAGISLCTFDDQVPSRAQLRSRLSALFLSVLPLGLGVAWAIFDENHLSWHDRLSRTYQRK